MPFVEIVVAPGPMPRMRGECIEGPRPCPYTSCRHHLANEVRWPSSSERRLRVLPADHETCALDVADGGPHTLEDVAALLGITRERVRQIEARALDKAKRALQRQALEHGGTLDDFRPPEPPAGEVSP